MNPFSIPAYAFVGIYLIYSFFRDRKKFFMLLSSLLFSYFLSENLKFIFKVPRNHKFSPYAYPSSHTSVATTFLFFLSKREIILFIIPYILLLYGRIWIKAHEPLDLLGGFLTGILSYILYKELRSKIGKEFDRKAFHVGFGTFLFLLTFDNYILSVYTLLFLSIFGFFLTYKPFWYLKDLADYYGIGKYKGIPAFTFVLGILASSVFGREAMLFGIQNLIWLDFGTFLVGKFFKTRKKSVYGVLGGYLFLPLPLIITNTPFSILYFLIPLIEFFSPYDNVTIPFFSAFLKSISF